MGTIYLNHGLRGQVEAEEGNKNFFKSLAAWIIASVINQVTNKFDRKKLNYYSAILLLLPLFDDL